ncbi:MAG: IS630 family transposase [Streptosporangiaceae bacterium]
MACRDLGKGARLAAAAGAWICFEDEAGQNLRPPKARTWAPRGHTPVVTVCGKGSGRVSVAGLVCLRPGARGHLFYRVRVHRGRKGERRSMSEADYAGLIAAAHKELHAPVILIWDNLNTHISAAMGGFVRDGRVRQLSLRLADRGPAACLRSRAQPRGGRLGEHEERPGQPRRP